MYTPEFYFQITDQGFLYEVLGVYISWVVSTYIHAPTFTQQRPCVTSGFPVLHCQNTSPTENATRHDPGSIFLHWHMQSGFDRSLD